MPSSFVLQVDTTAPSVGAAINAGAESTSTGVVSLAVTADADAYEVKVWGHIDPTDPANGSYGESEGGADWIEFDSPLAVRLAPGPGEKTLFVRVRDDVGNTSTVASDAITLVDAPVEPPRPVRPPLPGRPAGGQPGRRTATKVVRYTTELRLRTDHRVRVAQPIDATVSTTSSVRVLSDVRLIGQAAELSTEVAVFAATSNEVAFDLD